MSAPPPEPRAGLRDGRAWLLAGPYLGLVLLCAGYIAYRLTFAPANSELLGVYLVFLSLPWSLMAAPLGMAGLVGGVVGGIGLNAWLLYRLGRGLFGRPAADKARTTAGPR